MLPGLHWQELIIIGVIAILLFGKRLPEVAKSLGNSYRQFRRGLSEFQGSVDISDAFHGTSGSSYQSSSSSSSKRSTSYASSATEDYDEPTAPRFEPPPSEPERKSGDAECG